MQPREGATVLGTSSWDSSFLAVRQLAYWMANQGEVLNLPSFIARLSIDSEQAEVQVEAG